jgi:hypothetical protein
MKRLIICAVATAFAFALSDSADATAILSEQKEKDSGVNSAENTFKWSHSNTFKRILEEPLQLSFGPLEDNQDRYHSKNSLVHAFYWSHSFTLSGDQQDAPFRLNYHYGSFVDVESNYMSINGLEYTKRHGDVPDTAQHFCYYESYGLGVEPDTGYIPPEGHYVAPEPVSISMMGLNSVWIAAGL